MKSRLQKLVMLVIAAATLVGVCVAVYAADSTDTVRLDLKDVDVRSAIEALFRGTGKNFAIETDVSGNISSVSIKDVPFDVALKSLTKSAGLSYKMDNGIYLIQKKQVEVTTAIVPDSAVTPVVEATTTPETVMDKIALKHTNPTELIGFLNGTNTSNNGGGYGGGGGFGSSGGFGGSSGGFGGSSGGFGGSSGGFGGSSGGFGGSSGGFGGSSGGFGGSSGGYSGRTW